jgi:hypothetical protein
MQAPGSLGAARGRARSNGGRHVRARTGGHHRPSAFTCRNAWALGRRSSVRRGCDEQSSRAEPGCRRLGLGGFDRAQGAERRLLVAHEERQLKAWVEAIVWSVARVPIRSRSNVKSQLVECPPCPPGRPRINCPGHPDEQGPQMTTETTDPAQPAGVPQPGQPGQPPRPGEPDPQPDPAQPAGVPQPAQPGQEPHPAE